MKRLLLALMTAMAFAQSGFAQIQPVKLEGYYLPKNITGRKPADKSHFANFQHLSLSSNTAKDINGFLVTKAGSFKITKPKLKGSQFEFETLTIKGIKYFFAGKFVMTDFSESTEESEILSGALFKYKAGKIIATIDLDFDYWVGD